MADSTLLHRINENTCKRTDHPSKKEKTSLDARNRSNTPITEKQETNSDCMSRVRESYRNRGFSKTATNIIMCSWRKGTQKQYETYIKRWLQYCGEKQISAISENVEIVEVIKFLTNQYKKNLGYSALNTARGALSSLGIRCEGHLIGAHPDVVRFMKGVYNRRPPIPRYTHTWDLNVVLNFLRKLSPVKFLTLKDLTLKLTTLIAITNAARVQTLRLLSVNNMKKVKSEYIFTFDSLVKQSRPGFDYSVIHLKCYPPDRRLCTYTVLKEYLSRTNKIREKGRKELLISYVKPYKPVSTDTIARWIKSVLQRAGVDTNVYSAHSIRAASTSKAKQNSVNIQTILEKAGWSSAGTFAKFYDRQTKESTFEEGVLQ